MMKTRCPSNGSYSQLNWYVPFINPPLTPVFCLNGTFFRQGLPLKTMAIQWSIFRILLTLLGIAKVLFGISVIFHQSPDVFQFHVFYVLSMHEIKDYYQTIVRPHTTTYNCLLILHLCILICALQICRIQLFASLQTWKIIEFFDT